ncbi:MAG: hypothetical protein J1F23_08905 [Oscillospiraceae bacterium]|nr:hypothetical protein [Oscillospiraceae bacterium]
MVNVWAVSAMLEDTDMLSPEDAKKALPFCTVACGELSKRLKKPCYEDEPAVIMACAGLALYKYTLSVNTAADDFTSFKAGDVTVSKSPALLAENAVRFRDEAIASAAPFLEDVDFVFEAVEI